MVVYASGAVCYEVWEPFRRPHYAGVSHSVSRTYDGAGSWGLCGTIGQIDGLQHETRGIKPYTKPFDIAEFENSLSLARAQSAIWLCFPETKGLPVDYRGRLHLKQPIQV